MTALVTVVGTGAFAREHLLALRQVPRLRVAWVAGTDLDRAEELAGMVGARATTDIRAAVTDPAVHAVDVVNATPGHAPWTIAAGRAGKHVHVDKPAALALGELDAMVAATAGTSLMVGQTVRFQPAVRRLAQAVRDGRVGDPRLLHLTWYTGHAWPGGWRSWQLDPALSGGHPVHNGTHILDAATWLLGSAPTEVFARGMRTFSPDMESPDSFQVQLRTADGGLATLELCYALRQRGDMLRRVVLVGTGGTLSHTTENEPGLVSDAARPAPLSLEGALRDQLEHWADVVTGEAEPLVRTDEVRAALAGALAAQRSLVTGRRIHVTEIEGDPEVGAHVDVEEVL
ncbi:myo-inositol 2-dehydrogenase / D-chiro-inositol 1-dehydrogenase [Georgenia satyanarayanai]|uniref:Myo-inositol 2-dehydrogenase / D-chiro-inositol 1-dehydrogenase n=1 Tax=Georgenia satyanarayanai TaxID=860221 RepID=A0A2Y9A6X9_9MICO|nr:Gfo/Idh/MocA family oxidoreductase [Georgenia satyanarayanai]PYG00077.1 myo-inositol 2-dehydrogenase/D-chiro-inositol 1-dehydrogenase [Georgenia satyanarayanai]SSA40100.1 myo-inositol 2-dehydrogenase / D-chiro-inositol 1-dehydrogenase [Georgenia satyanarayanai]